METKVFLCGTPKDHKCDDDGPIIYFIEDYKTTFDKEEAMKHKCSGASVTCSKCGMSSMERGMWEQS